MDAQREIAKKKKKDRPIPDTRYLTRNDVIEAVRAIKAEKEIDSVIMQKMEKEDPRLYGITADPVSGTLVNLDGKKGRVVAARRDVDGYLKYCVELEGKHRKTKGIAKNVNTRQLLEAAGGEGVVRWEKEVDRVTTVFCAILSLVYVPVYKFVTIVPRVKRKVKPVDLKGEDGKEAVELREFAWEKIKGAPATHVVNDHEKKLLASDEGLEQELCEKGTLARVLGINLDAYSGLVHEPRDYAKQHYSTVDHYVKGAQAAYKLGRVMSFQSCMAPLSVGGVHDELPPGVRLAHEEQRKITLPITKKEASEAGYGLATRALVSRARVSDELCQWYASAPLYTVMLFSRPERDKKSIKLTTENEVKDLMALFGLS
ncbi:hypothetical protein Esi_0019_0124 [Ectocarpus siliculosus]|uniref:Uncharacterized protein n=1 Tax=Ectocarpus siliculosus TaxID=2880 RepID=D8LHA1_ECTSI|nr:hypothetical protein Esi_0019_0124 [Ectocarpus siliculosus]|eukprot:CBN74320.1 hypothetical protein Esi_0019_0124 [Ectocarpus siliculosus]